MGGLINAIFLLALCLIIFIESLKKFVQPSAVDEPLIVCIVGGIGEGFRLNCSVLHSNFEKLKV